MATIYKKQMEIAGKLAKELYSVVGDCIEGCGENGVMQETQDLLWDWEMASNEIVPIIFNMAELGYSVAIDDWPEMHGGDPEEEFLLDDFESTREFTMTASMWWDQMDIVNFHFFKADDKNKTQWLCWVGCNDPGERVADYFCNGDIDKMMKDWPDYDVRC